MIALRDSSFCTCRKIVHNLFCFTSPSGVRRCIMGDVQMENIENIRICIGEKVCNSHGKSENLIIIIFK